MTSVLRFQKEFYLNFAVKQEEKVNIANWKIVIVISTHKFNTESLYLGCDITTSSFLIRLSVIIYYYVIQIKTNIYFFIKK
jgi:hypothetical protein